MSDKVTVEVDHARQIVTVQKRPRFLVGPAPQIELTYADWLKATAVILARLAGVDVQTGPATGTPA